MATVRHRATEDLTPRIRRHKIRATSALSCDLQDPLTSATRAWRAVDRRCGRVVCARAVWGSVIVHVRSCCVLLRVHGLLRRPYAREQSHDDFQIIRVMKRSSELEAALVLAAVCLTCCGTSHHQGQPNRSPPICSKGSRHRVFEQACRASCALVPLRGGTGSKGEINEDEEGRQEWPGGLGHQDREQRVDLNDEEWGAWHGW